MSIYEGKDGFTGQYYHFKLSHIKLNDKVDKPHIVATIQTNRGSCLLKEWLQVNDKNGWPLYSNQVQTIQIGQNDYRQRSLRYEKVIVCRNHFFYDLAE